MKYTFVIDDDDRAFQEIKEAIQEVDPQMELRQYRSLDEFAKWIRTLVEQTRMKAQKPPENTPSEADALPPPSPDGEVAKPEVPAQPQSAEAPKEPQIEIEGLELRLVIIKSEFLKHKGFSLLQKSRDYFVARGICTKDQPTGFVVTAFETEDFDFKKYESQVISNIIFKPFDKLILRAHLRIALAGAKIEKGGDLYVQKTTSLKIEMLKEVPMIGLSETGFTTTSDREFPVGTVAKYYGKIFQSGRFSSVYAKLAHIAKGPDGRFVCDFVFFNIQPSQSAILRRLIKVDKGYESKVMQAKKSAAGAPVHSFVFLSPKDTPSLEESLRSGFQNVQTVNYHDYLEFLYDVDPLESTSGGSKSKEKPLPFQQGKIYIDQKFSKILQMEPAPSDTATFLGQPAKSVLDKEPPFLQKIYPDDRNRWLDLVKNQLKAGQPASVFRFQLGGENLGFVRVSKLEPFKHPKLGDVLELELSIATDQQKKEFLLALSRLPEKIDALFLDRLFLGPAPAERWGPLLKLLGERAGPQGIRVYVQTGQEIRTEELMEKAAPVDDVLTRPFDVPSSIRRILRDFSGLVPKEDIELSSRSMEETLKAAQGVPTEFVSESGLAIRYNRAIPVGQFRTVVLWMPHEIGLPEFLASCYAVEEVEENKEKIWICYFLFFGVRDTSLKHIRRWLKEYYVTHKDGES